MKFVLVNKKTFNEVFGDIKPAVEKQWKMSFDIIEKVPRSNSNKVEVFKLSNDEFTKYVSYGYDYKYLKNKCRMRNK